MQSLLPPLFLIFLSLFCFLLGVVFAVTIFVIRKNNGWSEKGVNKNNALNDHFSLSSDRRYQNEMSVGQKLPMSKLSGKIPDNYFLNTLDPELKFNQDYVNHMKLINKSVENNDGCNKV